MKQLARSQDDRKVAGVLGGISDSLNIDSTIIRVIFVILLFATGFFPFGIAYIIAAFVMPNESEV
ncbi:PspC domain-containing protein [Pseudalkalibacillus caeni]|uniref:PspC domain-containing protein n=1 Tax=Exobacillus caeni TaxID=2574798 RepID=A0A5R9FD85_9BACL|nr:PspC domain-containing protein [Pseudalkalibacillus caeni]TLS38524.1 PspC domain-containing protein [Pseudalkalibacillus caeni]